MNMIDYFDKLFTSIENKNRVLSKIKYYTFLRFTIKLFLNLIAPLYFRFTSKNTKHSIPKCFKKEKLIIVSLTSFPARIKRVWLVIETILRQTQKPDKIILWLSKEQFDQINKLPKKLLNQRQRGLSIRLCDGDLKSHKKYYYTLKEFPEDYLITVDDDILYPSTMLAELIELNKIYPSSICCHRAQCIKFENDKVLPYFRWNEIKKFDGPNYHIFLTSGGMALFPPYSLYHEVLNENLIKKYCLDADDIWLNIMCRLNDTTIVKSDYYSSLLLIMYFHNIKLYTTNVYQGGNDTQLKAVRDYYIEKISIDPFAKCFKLKSSIKIDLLKY